MYAYVCTVKLAINHISLSMYLYKQKLLICILCSYHVWSREPNWCILKITSIIDVWEAAKRSFLVVRPLCLTPPLFSRAWRPPWFWQFFSPLNFSTISIRLLKYFFYNSPAMKKITFFAAFYSRRGVDPPPPIEDMSTIKSL